MYYKILTILGASLATLTAAAPENQPIRVLVWDEQQPQQHEGYAGKFLGDTIAAHLSKFPDIKVTSGNLGSPEQGLDDATLDATDVIIWWGHVKHNEVTVPHTQAVVQRVLAGKLALIPLHSAHFSRPFMRLMDERARMDAPAMLPEKDRAEAKVDFATEFRRGTAKAGDPISPAVVKEGDTWRLVLPACVFPSWRADGAPSHVTTLLPEHPIAKGLPAHWDVAHTEMYSSPFHTPKPDAVIFHEKWDLGEEFPAGCLWNIGKGKVFYFRPGHETFGVYLQAEPLLVLTNAARWMGR